MPERHTNNLLVLIEPKLAGPDVSPQNYWKPEWVLWPASLDKLSAGDVHISFLVNQRGAISRSALSITPKQAGADASPFLIRDDWPNGNLMIAEASGWDDVRALKAATTGRVLVVEYPPTGKLSWSRYWLEGSGWPTQVKSTTEHASVPLTRDLQVPGLIPVSKLTKLAADPESFEWTTVVARSWPGANRFLEWGSANGIIVSTLWMTLFTASVIWGVYLVASEKTSRVCGTALSLVLLSPAIVDLAGICDRFLGMSAWPIWLFLSSLFLGLISILVGVWQKSAIPRAHPLFGTYLTGLLVVCCINPAWSFMSPLFGGHALLVSPVAVGAVFGYLTGLVSSLHGCGSRWNWVGRVICVCFVIGGIVAHQWWSTDLFFVVLVATSALFVGENRFLPILFMPVLFWPRILPFPVDTYLQFLTAPSLYLLGMLIGGVVTIGHRFFLHQIRALKQLDARRNAMPVATAIAFTYGILHPMYLLAGLTLACASMAELLFDAVRTM